MSKTTVEQLIADIDRRYPNTYTFDDKLAWINESLKEVYKDLATEEFYSFDTIPGEAIYNLPTDCTIDMIKSVQKSINPVSIGNGEMNFRSLSSAIENQNMIENSYFAGIDETQIGIYPEPEDVYRINIYYKRIPSFATKEKDFIDIKDDYINLIKFSVLATICMSGHNPDTEMANQYLLMYNSLVKEALQSKYENRQKYYTIRDVAKPRKRYLRR